MPGRLQFEVNMPAPAGKRSADGVKRILLLGDFSARPSTERAALATRRALRVDADTLAATIARVAPRVRAGGSVFEAEDIDDWHPDALYARLPLFAELRKLRQRLHDPAQFAAAAAELGAAPSSAAPSPGGGDLLAGLLGGRPAAASVSSAAPAPAQGIEAFVRNIVAPHVVANHGAQQAALVAGVDRAVAQQMRQLLHDGAFQALEAAWRGVQWLVQSVEFDESLQLHLLDVTRDEMLADLVAAGGRPADTGLAKALADGEGWSLVAGLQTFGPADADIGLLAALGLGAARAGAPFVAAGDTALALAEPAALVGWHQLRTSEAAAWLGLATPRVLLRRPYGPRRDPVAAFDFDELGSGPPAQAQLLWGAGSLAVALLVARGWQQGASEHEIDALPGFSFDHAGDAELHPCAELRLDEPAGQALLAAGLMPLMSHRHRNAVTLLRLQSIAHPARPLAGL